MEDSKPLPIPKQRRRKSVLQFLIVLSDTDPLIWRRILVPETYSFWDLHVAIQDAMGWMDSHLHEFRVFHQTNKQVDRIGIPDEDFPEDSPCQAGWQLKISDYFTYRSLLDAPPALYAYDFGDDWHHVVMCEDIFQAEASVKYPRCVAGRRACPPEDCGGVHGYRNFLKAIRDPEHPEHEDFMEWSGGSYDPDAFAPEKVVFDNPRKRWKTAFQE